MIVDAEPCGGLDNVDLNARISSRRRSRYAGEHFVRRFAQVSQKSGGCDFLPIENVTSSRRDLISEKMLRHVLLSEPRFLGTLQALDKRDQCSR